MSYQEITHIRRIDPRIEWGPKAEQRCPPDESQENMAVYYTKFSY